MQQLKTPILEIPLAFPGYFSFDSSDGDLSIPLEVEEGSGFQGICWGLEDGEGPYVRHHYIRSFQELKSCDFLLTRDSYGVTCYFCLSHGGGGMHLSGKNGKLYLKVKRGRPGERQPALLIERGSEPEEVLATLMERVLAAADGMGKLREQKPPLPEWLEYLGWESGAAFGLDVSHAKILEAVDDLIHSGFLPGYVLIDEGWQALGDSGGLLGFDGDPDRFPSGLAGLVADLRKRGVEHVGVWHGIMGARAGIDAKLGAAYQLSEDARGHQYLGEDLGSSFSFYHAYYGYLRRQGISFVKVGAQNAVCGFLDPKRPVSSIYRNLQAALQGAASLHFNAPPLHSECLRNENLYDWATSLIARGAEDIPLGDPEGVCMAVRNNLVNAVWLRHLMLPDFDAWRTVMPHSETLAIFHALSGSLSRIGDPPGQHNQRPLQKMRLPSGKLLQADHPLTLCFASLFVDPLKEKEVYKAYTRKGESGIVALFHLSEGQKTLHGTVSPTDVPGLAGERFAAFSHRHGFHGIVSAEERVTVTVKAEWDDIFQFVPVREGVAVIGSYLYYLPSGPITEVVLEEEELHITSLVAAPLILYCEKKILDVKRNGSAIPWEYDSSKGILSIDSRTHIEEEPSLYHITFE